MCFASPGFTKNAPAPLAPPPPPPPSATELEPAKSGKRLRPGQTTLDSLRIPLNPTGTARQPRIGL